MRTVYLGTSPFAVDVLRAAGGRATHRPAARRHAPRPPARTWAQARRRRRWPTRLASSAIEVLQPDERQLRRGARGDLCRAPDAVPICAFGALIREPLLSEHPMLNVHPSLLPRWRGAAPIERAIEAGDERDRRLDHAPDGGDGRRPGMPAGDEPIHARRRLRRRSRARLATLGRRAPRRGARRAGRPFADQPDDGVTFADEDRADDRRLDPALDAAALERRVRALTPHVGAFVEPPDGERLGVRRRGRAARTARASRRARSRHARRPALLGAADGRARAARGRCPPGEPADGRRRLPARARRRGVARDRLRACRRRRRARCAYRVVRRVSDGGAFTDRAFRAEADRAGADPRDRAFAQQLAYGTVQRRHARPRRSRALSRGRPTSSTRRCATRCGSGVARSSTSARSPPTPRSRRRVELAKTEGGQRLTGSSNAVMRRAVREADGIAGADRRRHARARRAAPLPPRRGSPGCGGRRSGPTRRAR